MLGLASLMLKLPLKLLVFEVDQPIVSRPLLCIAKEGVGGNDLPESRRGVGIIRVEVGVMRFDSVAERLLEGRGVVARMHTEEIVKRCHRRALERRSAKKVSPENDCMLYTNRRSPTVFHSIND